MEDLKPDVESRVAALERQGNEGTPHAKAALGLSVLLLGLGVVLGLHDGERHAGLRTFLSGGTILLLLSTYSVLRGSGALALVWSIHALSLFALAAYFRQGSADLRLVSFFLQMFVFIIAASSGALLPSGASTWLAAGFSLALGGATFAHYLSSRLFPTPVNPDSQAAVHWVDGVAVGLLVCSVLLAYFSGGNLLAGMMQSPAAIRCGQSIWLTFLAAGVLLIGNRLQNRESMFVGLLLFLAAAAKVFLIDFIQGVGASAVLSVATFGALAGISSYFLHRERVYK